MKKLYLLLASTFLFVGSSFAQNLLEWNFYSAAAGGKDISYAPSLLDSHMEPLELTRGEGALANNGYSHGFVATIQPNTTEDEAIANKDYFEFKVKAKEGEVSLSSLFAQLRTQNTATYRWKYAIDEGEFKNLTEPINMLANETASGIDQDLIDMSAISDLQNVESSTITFRLYVWGGTGEGAQGFGFGKSTTKNATIPYKASLVLAGSVQATQTVLAGWRMTGLYGETVAPLQATTINENVASSQIDRGSAFVAGSLGYAFGSRILSNQVTTKEGAKAANHYFDLALNLQPKLSLNISLKSLNYKFRKIAAAPGNYAWEYSLDGGVIFNALGADQIANTSSNGENYTVDLSAIESLQKLTEAKQIILRMYLWGDETTTDNMVFGFGRYAIPGTSFSDMIYIKGEITSTVSIDENSLENTSLTASATENCVVLKIAGESRKEVAKIMNLSGSILFSQVIEIEEGVNEVELPILLSKGVYIVSVGNESVKFIK